MQQTEIIDVLLLNSPLYGPGSLCVLMRRPRTGGEAGEATGTAQSVMEDERLEEAEGEERMECEGEEGERF